MNAVYVMVITLLVLTVQAYQMALAGKVIVAVSLQVMMVMTVMTVMEMQTVLLLKIIAVIVLVVTPDIQLTVTWMIVEYVKAVSYTHLTLPTILVV